MSYLRYLKDEKSCYNYIFKSGYHAAYMGECVAKMLSVCEPEEVYGFVMEGGLKDKKFSDIERNAVMSAIRYMNSMIKEKEKCLR